jgi:hypothetical protein
MVPVLEMHKRANSAPTNMASCFWRVPGKRIDTKLERMTQTIMTKRWTKKGTEISVFLIVALLTCISGAMAQTNNVTVTGVIKDPSGGLIPGAQVTAHNMATGDTKTARTDEKGEYTLLNLNPGNYDLSAGGTGFATTIQRGQVFYVGQSVTVNFGLAIATTSQTVVVEANSPTAISSTDSMVARVIEPGELDNLPTISRSFTDLAALSPGVQVATSASPAGAGVGAGNGISIGDAPGYQTGYIVDGVWDEVSGLGGAYINFAQDWIQEFSLVSQQAPAQYGGSAGGFVNAITRSGTNNLHGRAYMFYQNAALNATPRFLPAGTSKPPYNLERIGGMVGGPILKEKLFYFAGYEYFHDTNSIPVNVPAAFTGPASSSGVFQQTFHTNLVMAKLDWRKSEANTYLFRFNFENDNNQNVGIGASGSSVHTLGNATNQTPHDAQGEFRWGHTFSASSYNEVLGVMNYQITILQCPYAQAVGPYPNGQTEAGNPTGYWAQVTYSTAGVVVGCQANTGDASQDPTQNALDPIVTDVYSKSHGANDLKFGAGIDLEETGSVRTRNNYNGQYTITSLVPFNPNTPSTYPISDFELFGGGNYEHNKTVGPAYSFFAQDSLRAAKGLTLNIGIRYDFNTMNTWMNHHYIDPARAYNTVAQLNHLNNDYSDIAPRFGFAWTPFKGQPNTVVRGGLGVFYDQDKTAADYIYLIDGIATVNGGAFNLNATRPSLNPYCFGYTTCGPTTPGGPPVVPTQQAQWVEEVLAYSLANYTLPNFNLGTYTIGTNTYTIPVPTLGPPAVPGAAGTGGPAPTTGGTNAVDSNLKNPGEIQTSIGIGHDFTHNFTAAVDYVYVKGIQQIIIRNSNISTSNTFLNPAYGSISSSGNGGYFTDSSLRVKIAYRDRRGNSAQIAYTEARANDNSYNNFGINSHTINATNPFNYSVDYGPSSGDAHHILNFAGVYEAPFGIEVDPIIYYTSALPYTATTTGTPAGCASYYNQCYPVGYSKDSLRGQDTLMVNARLAKHIKFGSEKALNLFMEGFNLPNRTNYGVNYQANVLSSSFGKPTATSTNMRQFQIGGRFDF